MTTRRQLLLNGAPAMAAAAGWPSGAQADNRVRLIMSMVGPALENPRERRRIETLKQRVAERGWVEGRNVRWDIRSFGVDAALRNSLALEFVAAAPDLILATSSLETAIFAKLTKTIPILFTTAADPIGSGFLRSLTRPEGNITGYSGSHPEIGAKWIELLGEISPGVRRIGVMFNPATAPGAGKTHMAIMEREAAQRSLDIEPVLISSPEDVRPVLAQFAAKAGAGLVLLADSYTYWLSRSITSAANALRLPAIYPYETFSIDGGLMSYSSARDEQDALVAAYVDLILRGANIADLPVQFGRRFELVINTTTAAALGLEVPASLRARAVRIVA
ncbi:ABC transporter substrate-binding protein [Terrarubrum flagellatum]|uniref:ABC transporter substrate-binding protein n=1 Tax=Terrirubrum flagellatum TaxID=2895980 RepID=UPI00314569E6